MSGAPSIDDILREVRDAGPGAEGNIPPLVRSYLDQTRAYLAELHQVTASGRIVNEANSDLVDRLVRRLFSLVEEGWVASGGEVEGGACVVAVGGYARREMAIHSDVDLLVLYRDKLTPYVAVIAEKLQYWLWDAGVTVGCATRTIKETVVLGRDDATVRTAVLTARFLCGDGEFYHDFADTIRRELLGNIRAFIAEQQRGLQDRHRQYGESLFLLQPNVKEGVGALRDYHAAYWVARGAQPSVRDLDDLLHFGLLTESEMNDYRAALDFLWRVRNDLHLHTKRRSDQMSFELQEAVAVNLGYDAAGSEEAAESDELPVERFMRDYYRHARAIQNLSELVIEQCLARVERSRRRRVKNVEDGFRVAGGQLEIPHSAHLREQPVRLLRAYSVAQLHDVPLSRMAKRLVRENLDLIDDEFRKKPECTEIFLQVLEAECRVMRTLMDMNEVGLLAAFLPEWEHIVCRWQHVIYHTYTVDVHSIFLVEELRRLGKNEYEQAVPDLTALIKAAPDRAVLFLGCLLHDIGKGFGGDHSGIGTKRAAACLQRMGLVAERAERVLFLVQQHLWMNHLAQRRDLSDPRLILDFARVCGDRENLRNLYLLTFADIRASSRDAWNDWKGQLLRELFERTAEFLEVGADDPGKAMDLIEARVEVRREKSRAELVARGMGEAEIDGFFEVMPRRYFVSHTPKQIARHARVLLRFRPDDVLTTAFLEMRADFAEFIVCTTDVHGLYATVAGVLMSRGVNILGSHVYTTRSGLALEVYRLSAPPGGSKEREMVWTDLESVLNSVLSGETSVEELLSKRRRPFGGTLPPSRREPAVLISNTESDFYTLVDIVADDRIGLLYDLTSAIAGHDLEIYISKATTILDQVADTFYVKDGAGRKVRDAQVLEALRRDLLEVVERGEERERA
ncbi:MAG: [protein-PII] uridylyltransferase [Proteobacteria bacterium]|nr:[protein-PII] uridylyltransferase [Pseudomonadota bacterium]